MKSINPPEDLNRAILGRISHIEKQTMTRKKFAFGALLTASVSGLVPALIAAWNSFIASGMGEYISLALSDSSVATSYWQEIVFSVSESFPVVNIGITLIILFVCIWSFGRLQNTVSMSRGYQLSI